MTAEYQYAKRRPIDNEATWGEANVWSVYVFLYLFWIYGVVPHQWLTLPTGLPWRADKELIDLLGLALPMEKESFNAPPFQQLPRRRSPNSRGYL